MRKNILAIFLVVFLWLSLASNFVLAQEKVELIFFRGEGCPHCAKEENFLAGLENKYLTLEIKDYEIWRNSDNQKKYQEFVQKYHVPPPGGVPLTIINDRYFLGYQDDETTGRAIEQEIIKAGDGQAEQRRQEIVKLPFLGKVDLTKISLPLLTVVLGALDGFNPCAMWVLVVLISLLLGLKSRKKIALVGGIFIFAEGLLYFLFMTAWLNALLAVGYISLIRLAIGAFGIIFGALRVRDFINFKPGVCKVVGQKESDSLFKKIEKILKLSALPALVLGIFALAFSVNLIELFCSAGFPAMYTQLLSLQDLEGGLRYWYLAFYNLFYMLDDLVVFGFAFFTLSHFKFSDKYNRYSTLVAGLLILILGILLILKPGLLMFG